MRNKKILIILVSIFFSIIMFNTKVFAANLDKINNYEVRVEPRMNDGSLDITYNITWEVLDSTTEGPLTWVTIGTPNDKFDTPTALSSTIKSIKPYNGAYVRIDFTRAYHAGEKVTFKYSIHQPYMYKLSFGKVKYKFTPAWFTDARVDNLTILWNSDSIKKSDTKLKEDNYLIWNKTDLGNGAKVTINVTYEKSTFGYIDSNKQRKNANTGGWVFGSNWAIYGLVIFIAIISSILGGGGGYYGHSGFYGGGFGGGFYGGCASSCACAHSSCASSCACACAGSGRAGCSLKDFYGTNVTSEKLERAFKVEKSY